jgi:ElaB/YqjD/DUF883 family membrane-anchored ribosome-binding protein
VQSQIADWGLVSESPAEEIRQSAVRLTDAVRKAVENGSESIREFTTREPARALGLALGIGVILGWLIKRR